jgi:hypothetical protein
MLKKYLCVTKCWHLSQLFHADKTYKLESAVFEKAEKDKKPIRHFVEIGGGEPDSAKLEAKAKAVDRYKAELKELESLAAVGIKKGEAPSKTLQNKIDQIRARIEDIEDIEGPKDRGTTEKTKLADEVPGDKK